MHETEESWFKITHFCCYCGAILMYHFLYYLQSGVKVLKKVLGDWGERGPTAPLNTPVCPDSTGGAYYTARPPSWIYRCLLIWEGKGEERKEGYWGRGRV